jgi:glycosyltransferase involved in cell wall biosynthesis
MKIAFDAKRAFHNRRGLGNYSRDVIRLVQYFAPENNYFLLNPKLKGSLNVPKNETTQMIYPTGCVSKLMPSWWRTFGCLETLQGINIYHGLSQELPYGIHRLPIKKVVTVHDAIFMRYPEQYDLFYRAIFTRKNIYACRVADKIIAISEQTKQDCITYFDADESKIEVVYQGCNNIFREYVSSETVEQVKRKYDLPANYLLDVGAIEPRKNLGVLLKALSVANVDVPLVVVGSASTYADEMKKMAVQLGIEKRLFFRHNVASFDLPALYKGATVFVYPSIFEGFGIPILEAMCIGTPVLTSTGSCFAETGGDAAHYANPNDAAHYADELDTILDSQDLQKKMSLKGKMVAENFTDDKVAKKILSIYEKLY